MPTVPSNPKCSTLGCKNPKAKQGGVCLEHGGRDTYNHKRYNKTDRRLDASDKYNSKFWHELRQIQLSTHPLCASCLSDNIVKSAEHIDHIFPWQHIGAQAFTHNIFQSLCGSCHSAKTALEQRGVYRFYGAMNKDYALSDYDSIVASAQQKN